MRKELLTRDDLRSIEELVAMMDVLKADLDALHRKMDPLVDEYERFPSIQTDEDKELHEVYSTFFSAWWDVAALLGLFRAAQRRLRDGDGISDDFEEER